MTDRDIVITAVLEDELFATPPLMPVIVARLNGEKKDIPTAFSITRNIPLISDIRHLRRVRDTPEKTIECIMCPCRMDSTAEELDDELKKVEKLMASEKLFDDFRVLYVPSCNPRTEQQLKACNKIWPCKFARCDYLIKCIEGSLISQEENQVIRLVLNETLDFIDGSQFTSAAVVFRCAKIYGVGQANSAIISSNPTKHSTMLSIDSVATDFGSGHWKCTGENDRLRQSIQSKLDDCDNLKEHKLESKFSPYLCTNYDIFVTEEPCIMCTMGLVQSRIRRLFYLDKKCTEDLKSIKLLCYPDGAIEKYLIHRDKNLNHRFEAWRITLAPSAQ